MTGDGELLTGDGELLTRDPRWYNIVLGSHPLNFIFTGVDATGALFKVNETHSERQIFAHLT